MTSLWNKLKPWTLMILAVAALGFAFWYDRHPRPSAAVPDGYEVPLVSSLGATTPLSHFKGQWLVVAFGFVSCPDICPVHMAYMAKELRSLGASKAPFGDDKPVLGIFISVDPKRDTPVNLEAFRQIYDQNQNQLIALTGTEDQLQKVARAYGAFFEYKNHPLQDKSHYDVLHSTGFYVIDPEGRLATVVSLPAVQGALQQKLDRMRS